MKHSLNVNDARCWRHDAMWYEHGCSLKIDMYGSIWRLNNENIEYIRNSKQLIETSWMRSITSVLLWLKEP